MYSSLDLTSRKQIDLSIDPIRWGGIDIEARLYSSSGELIDIHAPRMQTAARFKRSLEAGSYYLSVRGEKFVPVGGSCWKVGSPFPNAETCPQGTGNLEYGVVGSYTVFLNTSDVITGTQTANNDMDIRADRFALHQNTVKLLDVLANDRISREGDVIVALKTLPNKGIAEVNQNNQILYTANQNETGEDQLVYEVTVDGKTIAEEVNLALLADDQTLWAQPDRKITIENHSVTIHVTENDYALNDQLRIEQIGVNPQNGQASISLDGTILYRPNRYYSGNAKDSLNNARIPGYFIRQCK